jgi:SAM-dependent methyltransferase
MVHEDVVDGRVRSGELRCAPCQSAIPIRGFIPRFVPDTTYADTFGFQWNLHTRTQYDRVTGVPISEERFFGSTGWPRRLSADDVILEAGSGAGRFTGIAASTGAQVVSFDLSHAVDANYRENGHLPNLLIVQAGLYAMPFRAASFPKVVCIGVIQHTPDPRRSFDALASIVSPDGLLVIDVYIRWPWWKQMWRTKYWLRPIARRLPPPTLHRVCHAWVSAWWPVTGAVVKLTGSRAFSKALVIADYRGVYPLPDAAQKEWAILDTFDMLSPAYDFPQTVDEVRRWFETSGFQSVDVAIGYNGVYGRGRKPKGAA